MKPLPIQFTEDPARFTFEIDPAFAEREKVLGFVSGRVLRAIEHKILPSIASTTKSRLSIDPKQYIEVEIGKLPENTSPQAIAQVRKAMETVQGSVRADEQYPGKMIFSKKHPKNAAINDDLDCWVEAEGMHRRDAWWFVEPDVAVLTSLTEREERLLTCGQWVLRYYGLPPTGDDVEGEAIHNAAETLKKHNFSPVTDYPLPGDVILYYGKPTNYSVELDEEELITVPLDDVSDTIVPVHAGIVAENGEIISKVGTYSCQIVLHSVNKASETYGNEVRFFRPPPELHAQTEWKRRLADLVPIPNTLQSMPLERKGETTFALLPHPLTDRFERIQAIYSTALETMAKNVEAAQKTTQKSKVYATVDRYIDGEDLINRLAQGLFTTHLQGPAGREGKKIIFKKDSPVAPWKQAQQKALHDALWKPYRETISSGLPQPRNIMELIRAQGMTPTTTPMEGDTIVYFDDDGNPTTGGPLIYGKAMIQIDNEMASLPIDFVPKKYGRTVQFFRNQNLETLLKRFTSSLSL